VPLRGGPHSKNQRRHAAAGKAGAQNFAVEAFWNCGQWRAILLDMSDVTRVLPQVWQGDPQAGNEVSLFGKIAADGLCYAGRM
jgi:hypothetical protein